MIYRSPKGLIRSNDKISQLDTPVKNRRFSPSQKSQEYLRTTFENEMFPIVEEILKREESNQSLLCEDKKESKDWLNKTCAEEILLKTGFIESNNDVYGKRNFMNLWKALCAKQVQLERNSK